MKKLIFTLTCLAITMQFSFAQYHVSYVPVGLNSFPGDDTTLLNTSFDPSTFLPICNKTDSLTQGPYTDNFNATTGYANGTNSHGDLEKMEKYLMPAKSDVNYVMALIYFSTSNSNDSVAAILHSKDGTPLDTSAYIHLDSIAKSEVLGSNANYQVFTFNGAYPIYTADSIYVGLTMPKSNLDSIAVTSSPEGCYAQGNLAWEKRSDNSYHPFSQAWNLNVDFLIFPMYEYNSALNPTSTGPTLNGLTINAAYPNPTNNSVNISYAITQSSNVRIEIYNTIGQQVKAESLGNQKPGKYTQNIDMSQLAKGTYFYSIITDNARLFGQIAVQ